MHSVYLRRSDVDKKYLQFIIDKEIEIEIYMRSLYDKNNISSVIYTYSMTTTTRT
jgi:hypothetical protein